MDSRGLTREAVLKDGKTLPNGNRIPRGSWLGVAERSVHLDERFSSNVAQYEPFRFDRSAQQSVGFTSPSEALSEKVSECQKNATLPSTNAVFMAWGHGHHAW